MFNNFRTLGTMHLLLMLGTVSLLHITYGFQIDAGLTFLVRQNEVWNKEEVTVQTITLIQPLNISVSSWNSGFEVLEAAYSKFRNLKIFTDMAVKREYFDSLILAKQQCTQSRKMFKGLFENLNVKGQVTEKRACIFIVPGLTENILMELSQNLESKISKINQNWISTDLTPERVILLSNFITTFSQTCDNLFELIKQEFEIWNTLQGLRWPQFLSAHLESTNCITKTAFESITVSKCWEERMGLICTLNVRVANQAKKYYKMQAVNHGYFQIGEARTIFVQEEDDLEIKMLDCMGRELQTVNDFCQLKQLENNCSDSLLLDDIPSIIKNCPFSNQYDIENFVPVEGNGYLIHKDVQVEEKGKTIEIQKPFLIFPSAGITVKSQGNVFHLLANTEMMETRIIKSNLHDVEVLAIQSKVFWSSLFKHVDWDTYLNVGNILFDLLVIFVGIIGSILKCRRRAGKNSKENRQNRRKNFREARELLNSH